MRQRVQVSFASSDVESETSGETQSRGGSSADLLKSASDGFQPRSALSRTSTRGAAYWAAAFYCDRLESWPTLPYEFSPGVGWTPVKVIVAPQSLPEALVIVEKAGRKAEVVNVPISETTKVTLEPGVRCTVGIHHPRLANVAYVALESLSHVWDLVEALDSRVKLSGQRSFVELRR
jgi:hypothetical protein